MNEQRKELAYKIYSFLKSPYMAKQIVENLSEDDLKQIEEGIHTLFLELAEELGYGYCDTCEKISSMEKIMQIEEGDL